MLNVTLVDVPNHLRSGERYKAMLIDPVSGFDIPYHCFKTDLTVQNVDAAIRLLSTLQHWEVNDLVPIDLVEWVCKHPGDLRHPALKTLAVRFPWLRRLLGAVVHTEEPANLEGLITKPDSRSRTVDSRESDDESMDHLPFALPEVLLQQPAAIAFSGQLAAASPVVVLTATAKAGVPAVVAAPVVPAQATSPPLAVKALAADSVQPNTIQRDVKAVEEKASTAEPRQPAFTHFSAIASPAAVRYQPHAAGNYVADTKPSAVAPRNVTSVLQAATAAPSLSPATVPKKVEETVKSQSLMSLKPTRGPATTVAPPQASPERSDKTRREWQRRLEANSPFHRPRYLTDYDLYRMKFSPQKKREEATLRSVPSAAVISAVKPTAALTAAVPTGVKATAHHVAEVAAAKTATVCAGLASTVKAEMKPSVVKGTSSPAAVNHALKPISVAAAATAVKVTTAPASDPTVKATAAPATPAVAPALKPTAVHASLPVVGKATAIITTEVSEKPTAASTTVVLVVQTTRPVALASLSDVEAAAVLLTLNSEPGDGTALVRPAVEIPVVICSTAPACGVDPAAIPAVQPTGASAGVAPSAVAPVNVVLPAVIPTVETTAGCAAVVPAMKVPAAKHTTVPAVVAVAPAVAPAALVPVVDPTAAPAVEVPVVIAAPPVPAVSVAKSAALPTAKVTVTPSAATSPVVALLSVPEITQHDENTTTQPTIPPKLTVAPAGDENADPNDLYWSAVLSPVGCKTVHTVLASVQDARAKGRVKGPPPKTVVVVDLTADESENTSMTRRTRSHTRPAASKAASVPVPTFGVEPKARSKPRKVKPASKSGLPFEEDWSFFLSVTPIPLPMECPVLPPTALADVDTLTKLFATANMEGPPPSRSQRVAPLPLSALAAAVNSAPHGGRG
jgi:hypothetical protein